MAIGESMRFLREEKGYSLKKVEELTGIDNGNLSRYERNLNIPNIEICMQLAKLYCVSIDELVGKSDLGYVNIQSSAPALSEEETQLLELFGKMNRAQRIRALAYCEGIIGISIPKFNA